MKMQYTLDDIKIRELVAQDSGDVVKHLLSADMVYWEAVKKDVIYPFLNPASVYGRRIHDKNIDRDEVYDYVYEEMVIKKRLENLRNKDYVLSYIIERVKTYVRSKFERKRTNGEGRERTVPVTVSIESVEGGVERLMPSEEDHSGEEQVRYDRLHESFDILWQQNPRRAVVLLLKYVNGLSAREIRSFLDLASENYVNQVAKLAKGDMQEIFLSVEKALNK